MDVSSSPIAPPNDQREEVSVRVLDLQQDEEDDDNTTGEDWSTAKRQSFQTLKTNPNAYYYRHVAPGETKRNGPWTEDEKRLFLEVIKIHPPTQGKWGLFAKHIPGRVGYQCRNFYHRLLESGELTGEEMEMELEEKDRKTKTKTKQKAKKTSDIENDEVIVRFPVFFACEEEVPRRKKL